MVMLRAIVKTKASSMNPTSQHSDPAIMGGYSQRGVDTDADR